MVRVPTDEPAGVTIHGSRAFALVSSFAPLNLICSASCAVSDSAIFGNASIAHGSTTESARKGESAGPADPLTSLVNSVNRCGFSDGFVLFICRANGRATAAWVGQ